MMSCNQNEAVNDATLNLFIGYFVEFEQCFCSKPDHISGNLGVKSIEHVSEMELYIIILTSKSLNATIGQF